MPIEGNIPASVSVPQQPFNPLATAGQAVNLQLGLNQNKLFGQEYAARSAIGPIYQESIDPTTGRLDANKLLALASRNPATAWQAGDLAAAAQAREAQQIGIDQQNLQLQIGRAQAFRTRLAPLLAKGANITPDDVVGVGTDLIKEGILPAQSVIGELANMPSDPKQLAGWVAQHYVSVLNAEEQMKAVYGTPQLTDTGPALLPQSISPMTGVHSIGEPIMKGLTPESATAPFEITMPDGSKRTVTRQQFIQMTQGGGTGSGGSGSAAGGPGVLTGISPAAQAAGTVSGTQNAQQGIALQQRAAQVPTNKAVLGNMEARLDQFDPGPQSQWWKTFGQMAAEYHQSIPFAPPADKVGAQEEFGKLAFQLAQSQFQALGGTGTDSKLDNTMHTSPSELLSRYGNRGIIHILKGNEDAINAQNEAWQKWQQAGHGPETYGQFQTQWNKLYDPRVFQAQYMSPAERQQMLKGMTKTEQAQFAKVLSMAQTLGWIPQQ